MAASRSTYTALIVLGFLMILAAITYMLHFPNYDNKLVITFVGMGIFIMLISVWVFRKTGVVRIIRPYFHLGTGTFIVVLGFLLILLMITFRLMNAEIDPRLHTIVPIIGIFFIILGYLLAGAGKQRIRLDTD